MKRVHKIGCVRTIQTAVMVVAYLQKRHHLAEGHVRFMMNTPSEKNGWWLADIVVDEYGEGYDANFDRMTSEMVAECRAFAAARGEIWA